MDNTREEKEVLNSTLSSFVTISQITYNRNDVPILRRSLFNGDDDESSGVLSSNLPHIFYHHLQLKQAAKRSVIFSQHFRRQPHPCAKH